MARAARSLELEASIPDTNAWLKESNRLFNDAKNITSMEKLLKHTISCVKLINRIDSNRGHKGQDFKGHLFNARNALHKGFKSYTNHFGAELKNANEKTRRNLLGRESKPLLKKMIDDWSVMSSIVQKNEKRLPAAVVRAVADIGNRLKIK